MNFRSSVFICPRCRQRSVSGVHLCPDQRVRAQRDWISANGGDLDGYMRKYLRADRTPDDVEAIYDADRAELNRLICDLASWRGPTTGALR